MILYSNSNPISEKISEILNIFYMKFVSEIIKST